ncbi:hypothetical protein GCM10023347_36360 [Streptomyces chumphonensis]
MFPTFDIWNLPVRFSRGLGGPDAQAPADDGAPARDQGKPPPVRTPAPDAVPIFVVSASTAVGRRSDRLPAEGHGTPREAAAGPTP